MFSIVTFSVFSAYSAGDRLDFSRLEFASLAGQRIDWQAGSDKKLIYFWATWCSECRGKLLHELVELDKRNDVDVLTVSIDKDSKRIAHFLKKNEILLPVAVEVNRYLQQEFSIVSVPYWMTFKKFDGVWKLGPKASSYDAKKIKEALR